MENLYEKYEGMLMTFPDEMTAEDFKSYQNRGKNPARQKYDRATFCQLVEQAAKYTFREIRYVDGERVKTTACYLKF